MADKKTETAVAPENPVTPPSEPQGRVAVTLEEGTEVGFIGHEVDGTDDHAYTVAGVTGQKKGAKS